MFITNRKILEMVYDKIKHILENNLNRRERMCLETILGFFLYEANKNQKINCLEKNWGTAEKVIGNPLNFDNLNYYSSWKYTYFTKISLLR